MTASNAEFRVPESPLLVVDDDFVGLARIRKTLEAHGYRVQVYESAREAWKNYQEHRWCAVLSDFYMPEMDGREFMRLVRDYDRDTPFLFLTANDDLSVAVDLIKLGADDFIIKPFVEEVLVFRVNHAIHEREQQRAIARIEQERELLELENKKLVSWRNLYGMKDIAQTQQMVQLLSRNINQSGGFLWIDLLKSEMQQNTEEGRYSVNADALEMAITAAEGQRAIFDDMTFIAELENMELQRRHLPVQEVADRLTAHIREVQTELEDPHTRRLSFVLPSVPLAGTIEVDLETVQEVIHELFVNAVKFSPTGSRIFVEIGRQTTDGGEAFVVSLRNPPAETRARDQEGNPIVGIPYDYAELVFDLFYSIEAFPLEIPQEKWRYGTGLYIARRLIRRQEGTLTAVTGVDYSGGGREPFVQLTMTLPLLPIAQ